MYPLLLSPLGFILLFNVNCTLTRHIAAINDELIVNRALTNASGWPDGSVCLSEALEPRSTEPVVMKKQFLLASVSIIAAVFASGAFAGDLNTTNINQTGSNGQVTIDQSGNGNTAGTATTSISQSLVQAGSP